MLRSLFDQEQFSDITITFEHYKWDSDEMCTTQYLHEVKCHKIILCHASKFFKSMCGSATTATEPGRDTIHLMDDGRCGEVNEAILRHIYGFSYVELQDLCVGSLSWAHMDVIIAARKYLLPGLEQEAVAALYKSIEEEALHRDRPTGERRLARSLVLLERNTEHNPEFADVARDLTLKHLPQLFKIQWFRKSLEKKGNKDFMDLIIQAVERGYQTRDLKA